MNWFRSKNEDSRYEPAPIHFPPSNEHLLVDCYLCLNFSSGGYAGSVITSLVKHLIEKHPEEIGLKSIK